MRGRRAGALLVWAGLAGFAVWVLLQARYSADLSAFLPQAPTPAQRLLVEQLQHGVASRLIIVGIEGADEKARTRLSQQLARRLRADSEFLAVENGDAAATQRDEAFLFAHRFVLSSTVTPTRFSVAGLRSAIDNTIDLLASPAGMLAKSWVPSDPTGEMMTLLDQLSRSQPPRTEEGVWVSRNGARALLLVRTRAAGSDTDAQQHAVEAIRAAFQAAVGGPQSGVGAMLVMSGPGVFAVQARASIKSEVMRLSIVSSALIIALLLLVYRSVPALLLGLVPVASGALAGIAAVALGFGVVQGVTLGFGVTLIGEGVDYSIYLFVQSRAGGGAGDGSGARSASGADWRRSVWPTIRLGMLTSVCGFAVLLASSFPGLAQLGLYSLTGVLAAGLVTRFVLPELLPRGFRIRDLTPIGRSAARMLQKASAGRAALALIAVGAVVVLGLYRGQLWSHDLSALSPVPTAAQNLDLQLRTGLGAPDVRYLVVISAPNEQSALEGAEHVGAELDGLVDRNVIAGYQSPAQYLPSLAVQRQRQASLPTPEVLQARLTQALSGVSLRQDRLAPFLQDVEIARTAPPLTRASLDDTSFAALADSLLVRNADGWRALVPLEAPVARGLLDIDIGLVRKAVSVGGPDVVTVLDLKDQADALYSTYLAGAVRLSLAGFATIIVLLLVTLRRPSRVLRVVLPLALAVLTVAAGLRLFGAPLTLLHVVGMLLIVAVGSNYALFFDKRFSSAPASAAGTGPGDGAASDLTLASLLVANCATVVAFGVLALSSVPVLHDLGETVAPGAFLALLYAALLAREPGPSAPGRAPPPQVALHTTIPGMTPTTPPFPPPARWRPSPLVRASLGLHAGALALVLARPSAWPWALGAVLADHALLTAAGLTPRSALLGPNWTRLPDVAAGRRELAITLDDGPDPRITPRVLDLLDERGAKATFFCIGERVQRHAEIAREMVRRGHAVENHSQRHVNYFSLLGPRSLVAEIERAQDTIGITTGQHPLFFRAPAGLRSPFLDPVLSRLGLRLASWTRRGFDTVSTRTEAVLGKLTRGLAAGDILLLHDGRAALTGTGVPVILEVLPRLLDALAVADLTPVTLRSALRPGNSSNAAP